MLISDFINDSFGLLSRQLRFYCWHYKRDLDQKQKQELIEILHENCFQRLSDKIKTLLQGNISDCKQQIAKLLFEHCQAGHRRHQLIQLIESNLVDINVRLDNYGRTLLHRTAYNLDVELVELLINNGVNIRLRDYAGNTALHIVIQSWRNGTLINNDGPSIIENLKSIIRLLLEADKSLQSRRSSNENLNNDDSERDRCVTPDDQLSKEKKSSIQQFADQDSQMICDDAEEPNETPSIRRSSKGATGSHHKYYDALSQSRKPGVPEHIIKSSEFPPCLRPILIEESMCSLVDTKNAFGRTALHYCVLVIGEQYVDQIVQLLLSYGAEPDAIDTRLKTPLYCLVKRPIASAIKQKCLAIKYLLDSGCDDLGLAINPQTYFTKDLLSDLEKNISTINQTLPDSHSELIFTQTTFKRAPSLKHLARLALLRSNNTKEYDNRMFALPDIVPRSLNHYVNKRVLDQSELF